jgi:hypothetical protein
LSAGREQAKANVNPPEVSGADLRSAQMNGARMDTAVELVQAYLHVNGYLTVTEYPVAELTRHKGVQNATDIDILGIRLPQAGGIVHARSKDHVNGFVADPMLGVEEGVIDFIIGEVKEGPAQLNRGTRDAAVLTAVLLRFGCGPASEVPQNVQHLLHEGVSRTSTNMRVRLLAFGSSASAEPPVPCLEISHAHILRFLQDHLRDHWEVFRQLHTRDPAFGFLLLMEKAFRAESNHSGHEQHQMIE